MRLEPSPKSTIHFYFPELSCQQLLSIDSIKKYQDKINRQDLVNDWQQEFCKEIGFGDKKLPWNKLRALQFDIGDDVQTVVCCDPVMMQMTHRGAYLWGQSPLEFSKEDVIRIIAQINQQLMGDDECFYLLDDYQWLYTSKKTVELSQNSFEEYIGKDMFGFSYPGNDGIFWDKLATEIQMLIKQMMDYQGLTTVPAEMIVNVHFWGDTKNKPYLPFEPLKKISPIFLSNVSLALFFQKSGIKTKTIKDFIRMILTDGDLPPRIFIVVMTNNEIIDFSQNLEKYFNKFKGQVGDVQFITQDKILKICQEKTRWQKIFDIFK